MIIVGIIWILPTWHQLTQITAGAGSRTTPTQKIYIMLNRTKKLTPILTLFTLTLIFFWKIILTNLILVGVDVFLYFYPYKAYATEALLAGRLPLWNPHLFMGVPFLANSQVGLLYPLNWLFLWASPPKQVAYSIGLHVFLAGVGAFLFARKSLKLPPTAALVGAMVFAFSGFLGAQVEHINQLQVSAWLPWLFLLFDRISFGTQRPQRIHRETQRFLKNLCVTNLWYARRNIALLGLIIALMLLAGHTQSVYIALFGLGLYGLYRRLLRWLAPNGWTGIHWQHLPTDLLSPKNERFILKLILPLLADFLPLLTAIVLAVLIAAAQLLPTAELTRHSIRSGGLDYFEVVSFSLNPLKVLYTLFPPYGVDLEVKLGQAFSEFVAYIGIIPLALAALGGWRLFQQKNTAQWELALTGATGLFLAFGVFTGPVYFLLYKLVPGFNLFRVPARWLLLYTFAAAMLAAMGFARLKNRRVQWLALALIPLELFIAAQGLRYNQPTAPEAYSSLRPSIVQLLATEGPTDRFLSLSGIVYDPGDLKEIHNIFDDQLPPRAVYDYIVAVKEKEVLFFNLPLVYRLNAVDGYDGGLLPLKQFIELERVFLPADNLSLDGRLREKLTRVPPNRLLSLLGVRHIITDKVYDVWLNNIFYDLQFPANLSPAVPAVWTADIPADFPASAVGLVFHTPATKGTVAQLVVQYTSGQEKRFNIQAGTGEPWKNAEFGVDHNLVFSGLPANPADPIAAVGLIAQAPVTVRGVSLIQAATQTSRSLILTTAGHYQAIHSGDVKIYQNMDVLPRAFAVHQNETVATIDDAVARLRSATFNPAVRLVHVAARDEAVGVTSLGQQNSGDSVTIAHYTPEHITLTVNMASDGWVVLTDTYYPGWRAEIDGKETAIIEADVLFRAVAVSTGQHTITFTYAPRSFYGGVFLSILGLLVFVGLAVKRER